MTGLPFMYLWGRGERRRDEHVHAGRIAWRVHDRLAIHVPVGVQLKLY